MKTYTYTGSLRGDDIGGESYILHNGNNYDLPESDAKVKTMLRRGELVLVKTSSKAKADPETDPPADKKDGTKTEKGDK